MGRWNEVLWELQRYSPLETRLTPRESHENGPEILAVRGLETPQPIPRDGGMPDLKEEETRNLVLRALYKGFEEDPIGSAYSHPLASDLGVEENLLAYIVDRFDGLYLESKSTSGHGIHYASITPDGVRLLRSLGESTLLDDDLRFRILVALRDLRKEYGRHATTTPEGLATTLEDEEMMVLQNARFLAMDGLCKMRVYGGGPTDIRITKRGIELAEAFELHGGEPPDTRHPPGRYQVTVGPNERDKAEAMFRDQVELARREVILVDPWLKEAVFDWFKHIPPGVDLMVLTSDNVPPSRWKDRMREEAALRKLEIRVVKREDWGRHGRFLFRDETRGWSWDASFADAGVKRHTVTELEPVNCQVHVKEFRKQWSSAKVVA